MKFKFKWHVCNISLHSTGSLSTTEQVFRNAALRADRNYPRVSSRSLVRSLSLPLFLVTLPCVSIYTRQMFT